MLLNLHVHYSLNSKLLSPGKFCKRYFAPFFRTTFVPCYTSTEAH